MAVVANTFTTYPALGGAVGIREDLTDVIWNISPTETPFATGISRTKAESTYHEWQTDALASAAANAQLEGDDISAFDAVNPTVRLGNYCQISRKTVVIADTEEAVRKAGRKSELAYQIAKKGKELKRDIEFQLVGLNQAKANAAALTNARLLASVLSWIKTNTSFNATGGANPSAADGTGTRTDGTQRAFSEALLKTVLASIFANSGDEPEMILLPASQTQNFSAFTGNSTRFKEAEDAKLMAAIKVYEYDFGAVRVVPDRFMRTRDALIINTDLWALAWLRPIKLVDLAKTGDAEKRMILGEYTLECRNEAGSGGVFDLS